MWPWGRKPRLSCSSQGLDPTDQVTGSHVTLGTGTKTIGFLIRLSGFSQGLDPTDQVTGSDVIVGMGTKTIVFLTRSGSN
ncbi:hypothetical protein RRG08_032541 [Elysia crispata]|uniref:Uncharacterized protein n=1 Tax=Elysia crispata TaxID=231223 RepID=A0AAE0ZY50_9GAST|nr:hypothetical protein RRG08_032541 [Elysia crispata]